MATYLPSQDEQNILGTAEEARTSSQATFSYGLLYRNTPVLTDQQKLIFISSIQIVDAI